MTFVHLTTQTTQNALKLKSAKVQGGKGSLPFPPDGQVPSDWQGSIESFKQFVVTNCRKERPGSIVTKTQKNEIFIPIATSKESNSNAGLKYVSFIMFSLIYRKLRAWENFPYFRKWG